MSRLHVHLGTNDLDKTTDYYAKLFGVPPTRREDGYVQWLLDDPAVNFSLSVSDSAGFRHLGVETDAGGLNVLRDRLTENDAPAEDEASTECCYAFSDKVWSEDPDGISWELFHTHERAAKYSRRNKAADCCV